MVSERTFNFTLEAEVPCTIKNQQDKVVEFDQSNSGKTPDNEKVNATTAIDKVDQAPDRYIGKDSLVTANRLNLTLDAGKINVTSIREETTILAITNVTSIREETTILAITHVNPIRKETTIMSEPINTLATNGTAATVQSKIKKDNNASRSRGDPNNDTKRE